MKNLTQDYLKSILDYNPETGVFTWRERPLEHFKNAHWCNNWNAKHRHKIAGSISRNGYWRITIDNKSYRAHRISWIYVYGKLPKRQIDHINCNRSDNRIANLRLATNSENQRNTSIQKNNTSGYKGVSWNKRDKKWCATIRFKDKNKNLGSYDDPKKAHAAYCEAAKKLYGAFARLD